MSGCINVTSTVLVYHATRLSGPSGDSSRMSVEVQYPRASGGVGSWLRGAQKCGNLGEATRHGRVLLVSDQSLPIA